MQRTGCAIDRMGHNSTERHVGRLRRCNNDRYIPVGRSGQRCEVVQRIVVAELNRLEVHGLGPQPHADEHRGVFAECVETPGREWLK